MAATKHAQAIQQDSQTYLTEALFQLLEKKTLSEIKITELVARAGVSRMAFYRNYDSVEDILRQHFAPKLTHLFDNVIFEQSDTVKYDDMQAFFDAFASELRLSLKAHFEYVIRDLFTENMARYYANWPNLSPEQLKYWQVFMTNGVYGIWREWLLTGQKESLTDLHALIKKLQASTESAL
ncbi:TetR/AcrR family transcriptional regulator [Lacticaseibacillus porcinae]|uniref:TetR/AcrR family transcriptional regulator n=1 Tax=Lacticaseibacillus porcinae TaxID=1123687 RepID=UPI000F7719B7|nr:TetR/AcrR family transcriptional regulator [Lacticaseibacillus porcinae]